MTSEGVRGARGRPTDAARRERPGTGQRDPGAREETGARIPASTYRLQLGPGFRFDRAADLLPYLGDLGVTDLYLSPIFRSRAGSEHGYDVTDPTDVDPELGGLEGFEALSDAARGRNMGILLDTVPNHMAASADNPWWTDVLRHGPSSRFAHFFDIDWEAPAVPEGRLLLPILGEPYTALLERGAFSLVADDEGLWVRYGDRRLPVEPGSWMEVLGDATRDGELTTPPAEARVAITKILDSVRDLPPFTDARAETTRARRAAIAVAREALSELRRSEASRDWLERRLEEFARPSAAAAERMHRLLGRQPYALTHWHLAAEEINYRRFFDIGDMIAVRADQPDVFEATHTLVLRLAGAGRVTGLRIDHIDGLWDPLAYLKRLQRRLGESVASAAAVSEHASGRAFYVVVEKILSPEEDLPTEWPVHGTTGYDYLQAVEGVFIDREGLRRLDATYRRFTGREEGFADLGRRSKHQVMRDLFGAEIASLTAELVGLAREDRYARDLAADVLESALREVIACLPVYRTYVRSPDVREQDRALVRRAVEAARAAEGASGPALDFLERLLTLADPPRGGGGRWLRFVMRWQQVTGPVTAKGLEDTSLYRYNRLVALNEVGGEPDEVATVGDFHRLNERRLLSWPHSLNATTTHDTKRSEDVRARLDALTELPDAWEEALGVWSGLGERYRRDVDGERAPDRNEQVLLYQTLLGAWPLESGPPDAAFRERLEGYIRKALREAKVHTSWRAVNETYEEAVLSFSSGLLSDDEFLGAFRPLQERVAALGAVNSLGQALLTLCAPGVPDCYRGTELWDFSLVDPDNRRPVDFELRRRLLDELDRAGKEDRAELAVTLSETWKDGRIKLWLTAEALRLRRREPGLFRRGGYLPLPARGPRAAHVCAFARRHEGGWVLVAVPRLAGKLALRSGLALGPATGWGDTALPLPPGAPARWLDLYTRRRHAVRDTADGDTALPVGPLFERVPFALLLPEEAG